jgi:hypothetical protein
MRMDGMVPSTPFPSLVRLRSFYRPVLRQSCMRSDQWSRRQFLHLVCRKMFFLAQKWNGHVNRGPVGIATALVLPVAWTPCSLGPGGRGPLEDHWDSCRPTNGGAFSKCQTLDPVYAMPVMSHSYVGLGLPTLDTSSRIKPKTSLVMAASLLSQVSCAEVLEE